MTVNELIALLSRLSAEERELHVYAGCNSQGDLEPVNQPQIQADETPQYDGRGDQMAGKWITL